MLDPYNPSNWYWTVGGDETETFSSAAGERIPAKDATFQAWTKAGNIPTRIKSDDELRIVLRAANVPPYHRVKTGAIVARLLAADESGALFAAAHATILQSPVLFWRFLTAKDSEIDGDDADAIAFLQSIGANPDAILAP